MDTRSALIAAATRLFARHGYDAVGVREVVEAVGVSKPSLYHHFGSKLGLLDAVLADGREALTTTLAEAAFYNRGDLSGSLRRILDALLAFVEDRPDYWRLLSTLSVSPPEHEAFAPANAIRDAQIALLEALFIAAAADHGNMRGRHRRYAASFLALIHSVVARRMAGDPAPDATDRADIVHQFSHGIYS